MAEKKIVYLRQYLGAVLPQRPCVSSVQRALRSGVESSEETPDLRGPDRHARHRGIHPPWGTERSGLGEKVGTTGGGVNFLDPRVKNVFRFVSNQFFPIAINANPVNPFFALNIFYVEIIQKGNKCNSNYRRRQVCARS